MRGVTCELNQPLVLLERTKTSRSFSSRIIYSLSYPCDNACCHLQTKKSNAHWCICMDTPVPFPTFQLLMASHGPELSDFLEKGVSLTFMPLTFTQNHDLGNSIILHHLLKCSVMGMPFVVHICY